jgi:hypothetical protein
MGHYHMGAIHPYLPETETSDDFESDPDDVTDF